MPKSSWRSAFVSLGANDEFTAWSHNGSKWLIITSSQSFTSASRSVGSTAVPSLWSMYSANRGWSWWKLFAPHRIASICKPNHLHPIKWTFISSTHTTILLYMWDYSRIQREIQDYETATCVMFFPEGSNCTPPNAVRSGMWTPNHATQHGSFCITHCTICHSTHS